MVSAAKFAKAGRELRGARPYGNGAKQFYQKLEVEKNQTASDKAGANLVVAMTSDRGLCGAANTNVVKAVKNEWLQPTSPDAKIVAIGDKARGLLARQFASKILMHFTEVGKRPATFSDAAVIAEAIASLDTDFKACTMYYNVFRSVVSYTTSVQPLYTLDVISASPKISLYDSVDENVLKAYNEFAMTSLIYFGLKEASASEQSARMTAMDSASKNAGEMIDKLTLTYNRTRQAVITKELIEIISGAAALK